MGADGHPLTIRGLIDDDWAPIAELTNHYILHTSVHFSTDPVSVEELREGWEPYRVRYPFLVATLDDRFAGFAKASRWRERDAYAWTCETSIYLCDHIHGRGLGRRFYAALLDECRRRGFESAIGGGALPNDRSVRLHRDLGFVDAGVVRRAGWKFGAWHDVGFYQLMLGDAQPPRPFEP